MNLNYELIKILCQYFLSLVFFVGFDSVLTLIYIYAAVHTRVYVLNHPHLRRLSTKLAWYANEVIPFGCEFSIIHIMFAYNGQKHTLSQRNYIKFRKHGSPLSLALYLVFKCIYMVAFRVQCKLSFKYPRGHLHFRV